MSTRFTLTDEIIEETMKSLEGQHSYDHSKLPRELATTVAVYRHHATLGELTPQMHGLKQMAEFNKKLDSMYNLYVSARLRGSALQLTFPESRFPSASKKTSMRQIKNSGIRTVSDAKNSLITVEKEIKRLTEERKHLKEYIKVCGRQQEKVNKYLQLGM